MVHYYCDECGYSGYEESRHDIPEICETEDCDGRNEYDLEEAEYDENERNGQG